MEGRRAVMDLHWSPHFPELFLGTEGGREREEGREGGGLAEGSSAPHTLLSHVPVAFAAAYSGINDGSGGIFPSSSNSFSSSSSPSFPPSAAASFGAEEMDGLVLVWSLALPSR